MDDNPRPSKRQRISSPSTSAIDLPPLPHSALLLSLPSLLLHPPNHREHTRSLWLSLLALRKCLTLPTLEPYEECRALTEIAEIGFKIGLTHSGIESEVEKSITKALLLTQMHPSLRIYKPQITRLSARLSSYQQNPKFAQTTLKRILTSFLVPSDPPHIVYSSHLAYITSLSPSSSPSGDLSKSSNFRTLGAIRDLYELATKNGHGNTIGVLALVLELRDLTHNGFWNDVETHLQKVEGALSLFVSDCVGSQTTVVSPRIMSNLEKALVIHVLIIGVIFHTYVGDSAKAHIRLKNLHDILDGGALDAFGPSGIVEIPFENPSSPSLFIQVTHPRIIYVMGFLVSSVAKRDPVGRKPKRKVFAAEGLVALEREAKKEVNVHPWASLSDVRDFESRMSQIKADLICELIGVAICRSEFDDAQCHLDNLIAHTRTHNIFSSFCARITLHQAHLAHALGIDDRAEKCYKVAAHLSRKRMMGETKKLIANGKHAPADQWDQDLGCEDHWVNVSARVGEIWLKIGMLSRNDPSSFHFSESPGKSEARTDHDKENDGSESERQWQREMNDLRISSEEVITECEGLGGTLQAAGAVLKACLSKAFLQTKSNLRIALQLSSSAQDNHLRALILSLIASQYVHTSMEHAETIITAAEQLAAGLGAGSIKNGGEPGAGGDGKEKPKLGDGIGNAHLRLWIGERSLELKRRAGDGKGASRQLILNERLREAVVGIKKRKLTEVN